MLIVSKFHDYYDKAMKYGQDKTVVYERKGDPFENNKFKDLMPGSEQARVNRKRNYYDFTFHKLVIGFCGKLYPLVRVTMKITALDWTASAEDHFNIYSQEELANFMKEWGLDQKKNNRRYAAWHRQTLNVDSVDDMKTFFDADHWKDLLPLFRKLNAPVFLVGKDYHPESKYKYDVFIYPNPELKKYKFMKIVDTVTAFQNIFMYISGVLGIPERPMIKLTDKEMAKKRGHGDKYSFRKPPKEKK